MFQPSVVMHYFSSFAKVLAVVLLTGGGWYLPSTLSSNAPTAEVTLYFPPSRQEEWPQGDGDTVFSAPLDWIRSELSSQDLAEGVRLSLGPSSDRMMVESCNLICEDNRLRVELSEPGFLKIALSAGSNEIAEELIRRLVTYLQTRLTRERELVVQKSLAKLATERADAIDREESSEKTIVDLMRQTRLPAKGQSSLSLDVATKGELRAIERDHFLSGLSSERYLKALELRLALQAEAAFSGFTVIDSPRIVGAPNLRIFQWLGAVTGAVLCALLISLHIPKFDQTAGSKRQNTPNDNQSA